ncbi:MAG: O-methyltransferase [Ardenticatenia bacterium]|nr:O-methyltransferase [Ardenticatenia bacterium]
MVTYNEALSRYVTNHFAVEDEALLRVRRRMAEHGLPAIHIQPEEGRFLQVVARACGARRAVEVGTLGGYSAIWIARGMVPGGVLYTVERDPQHARLAREHVVEAHVPARVEVWEGDARDVLPELSGKAPFDLVFIDADKQDYRFYYEWAVTHLRVGGVVAAHNAFAHGRVVKGDDEIARLMRAFNALVAADGRVVSTVFPAGDGMVVAVKVAEADGAGA